MEKNKQSLVKIILKNLISPFPLFILLASLVHLIGSFFLKSGYSDGLILFLLYIAYVVMFVIIEVKQEGFRESKIYKFYIELSKFLAGVFLLLIAVTVIASLFYLYDIPLVVKAAANAFIMVTPLGLVPLYLINIKEEDEKLINIFYNALVKVSPILIAEVFTTIILVVFGFAHAFNSNEILMINVFVIGLAFLDEALDLKKQENQQEVASFNKNDFIVPMIMGVLISLFLVVAFLLAPIREIIASNQSVSLFTIRNVLKSEADVLNSAQTYLYVALAITSGLLLVIMTMDYSAKFNIRKLIFAFVSVLVSVLIIFVPWVKTFIFHDYLHIADLLFAMIFAILAVSLSFIIDLIFKHFGKTKKSN